MSELAAPLPIEEPRLGILSRALSVQLRLGWEAIGYAAILVMGAGMRFWDLGSRALHHDESLHGYYSYLLFRDGVYEHNPLMHGPFQFFGTALTFFVTGGANDYTVRILPALFGTGLILLPLLFRNRLGPQGALIASALIAFSPTLLYFSRFARDDIYVAVWTLALVICLWRYIDERKHLYLYMAAAVLGLSFATMENTFINVAIFITFLNLWLAADLASKTGEHFGEAKSTRFFYTLAYLPFAWAFAALWPFIGGLRQRLGLRELPPQGDFLVVLGTLSAPQFAAAIQVPLDFALGIQLDTLGEERLWGAPTVVTLIAATALVGLRWNWRAWAIVAVCFYVPYALLYTTFLTHPGGFGSGIWESLDYWLDQHDVRRGDQPDFYYVMLLPAYEFLALAFTGPALLYLSLRGGLRSVLLTALATLSLLLFFGADSFLPTLGDIRFVGEILDKIPLIGHAIAGTKTEDAAVLTIPIAAVALFLAIQGNMFERFLVFWAAASIVGYSWAGEKMPWLSVHTTLPVVILAAYALGQLFSNLGREAGQRPAVPHPWRASARGGPAFGGEALRYAPLALAAALGAAAVALAAFGPGDWDATRFALLGISLAPLAFLLILDRQRFALIASAAVVGALMLFTVRTGVIATYEHGDVPNDLLVYTQTSPDVPDVMQRIDAIARSSGRGHDLPVLVDTTYTWPWAWYLRDFKAEYITPTSDLQPKPGAVVLLARENESYLQPLAHQYQAPVPFRLRWWFPEEYRGIQRDTIWEAGLDFLGSLSRASTWENWWRFFRDREPPAEKGHVDSLAYFPRMYLRGAEAQPIEGGVAQADLEGRLIIGRQGSEPGALLDPSGLTLDAQGNIYVADSGNNRIQKFAPDGRFLAAVGGPGGEPGQFNQPADLAVDGAGNVYVVDTWNHRIQKFDANLAFVAAWGQPTNDLINPAPDRMWGPRAIAIDADGNLWVVDTGTNRVRKFAPDGAVLAVFGGRGEAPGRFQEPVGIAIAPIGDILIADAGNARIQRFDRELKPLAAYPVDAWRDLSPANKPYLAVLPDGRLLTTNASDHSVLFLDAEGRALDSLAAIRDTPFLAPRGLAFDAAGGFIFLAEGAAGQVRRFPLSDFALR